MLITIVNGIIHLLLLFYLQIFFRKMSRINEFWKVRQILLKLITFYIHGTRKVTEYDNFFILFSHTIIARTHTKPVYMKIGWILDWPGKLGWGQSGHLLTFSIISREECHLKVRASQMRPQKFQTSTEKQTMNTLYAHNLGIAIF